MNYLIVGDGRLATHLRSYFSALGFSFLRWSRKHNSKEQLHSLAEIADAILLAISDSQLQDFADENAAAFAGKPVVHFSGALSLKGVDSAHPLMTFGPEPYDLAIYKKIPFVTEVGRRKFDEIFPSLPNPSTAISPEQKPLYHALCSYMVNLPQIFWARGETVLRSELNLDGRIFGPILEQAARNFAAFGPASLTGPIARQDSEIVQLHLDELKKFELNTVYEDAIEIFEGMRNANPTV